jgi:hypothetical protein
MGYRGLLLNDPYKIDRIDGCVCLIYFELLASFYLCALFLAIGTREIFIEKGRKM